MTSERGKRRLGGRFALVAAALLLVLIAVLPALLSWTDRVSALLVVGGIIVLVVTVVDWLLETLGAPAWRLLGSVVSTLGRAVMKDPQVQDFKTRNPSFSAFLHRRTTTSTWKGLYLTVGAVATAYFLFQFAALAADVVRHISLALYDPRATAFIAAARSPGLARFMWVMTVVGNTLTLTVASLAVAGVLLLEGRRRDAAVFSITMLLGNGVVELLKVLFQRARPLVGAIALPASRSFPSGHAFGSLLFFGLLAFLIVRRRRHVRERVVVVAACTVLAALVGLSRIYLGVHWPTDVFASWLLAAAFLSASITWAASWDRYGVRLPDVRPAASPRTRTAAAVGAAALFGIALSLGLATGMPQPPPLPGEVAKSLPGSFDGAGRPVLTPTDVKRIPVFSEKLNGQAQEPVGLIFIGSRAQLESAFADAGWSVAVPATLANVWQESVNAVLNRANPTGPVTPTFLDGRVQDLAFEKSFGKASARQRHHNRWWRTNVTFGGKEVWVGTASLDQGVELSSTTFLPTHHIAPNIDAERDFVVQDLTKTGKVLFGGRVKVTDPMVGTDAQGDSFFTFGEAALLSPG